ncbi:MAG: M16 family metallopeptidase [Bacillota bacterium]
MNYKFRKTLLIPTLLLVIFIQVLAGGEVYAEQKLSVPEQDYSHFQLENGLDIYVLEDHSLPLVEFSIWYQVGSIDEPEGLSGISHLLEHVMFLGTDTLKKEQVHKLVKEVGGRSNAGTTFDYTRYYEKIPSAKLELAMAIEADRMRNLKIDPEEVAREKEVVKQERRQRIENDVFSSSLEEIQATAFPESPLNHQVIGWMEDIENTSDGDLKNYYQQYYVPNNAVMVVAGDVDPGQVHSLAQKYYGDYQPQTIERPDFRAADQQQQRELTLEKVTNLPIIVMMYKVPAGDHPDKVAIDALLDLLVNNDTSRVRTTLQREKELIVESGGGMYALRIPGFVLVYLVPRSQELFDRVMEGFDRELELIKQGEVTGDEVQIVKKASLKQGIFRHKKIDTAAQVIGSNVIRFSDPDLHRENLQRVQQLTAEDIARVANEYFDKDNRTVGYIIPEK